MVTHPWGCIRCWVLGVAGCLERLWTGTLYDSSSLRCHNAASSISGDLPGKVYRFTYPLVTYTFTVRARCLFKADIARFLYRKRKQDRERAILALLLGGSHHMAVSGRLLQNQSVCHPLFAMDADTQGLSVIVRWHKDIHIAHRITIISQSL